MKYKTFITTLLLFLITLYCGVMLVSVVTFSSNVKREKEKSLDDHYLLISGLVKDIGALTDRDVNIDENIGYLIQHYENILKNRMESIAITKSEDILYTSGAVPERSTAFDSLDSTQRASAIVKEDLKTLVYVEGIFPEPYEAYGLIYYTDITAAIHEWKDMKNFLFTSAAGLSLIFAFFNSMLLNNIFKPLVAIGNTSAKIADGDYNLRLSETSDNELLQVAQSFNSMMDEMQRHMKELVDAANQKQQFVDNFSHELNTPLTAIYGYAEYLQNSNHSQERKFEALRFIMTECKRIQNLANQMLELASLNNSFFSFEQCSLFKIFDKTQEILMTKLYAKQITLDIECHTQFIYGDKDLLLTLFINLIDNSVKACDVGGHILLKSEIIDKSITITVEDNGKGMAEKELLNITKPFYRINRARSRKDGGNGIGLSICAQIIELHNGHLEFYSTPKIGTKAVLTFTT